jgi:hypothetical protein
MAKQLRGPFAKFVDWLQCTDVMLLSHPLHNSGAMPPVHELLKRLSYSDGTDYRQTGMVIIADTTEL